MSRQTRTNTDTRAKVEDLMDQLFPGWTWKSDSGEIDKLLKKHCGLWWMDIPHDKRMEYLELAARHELFETEPYSWRRVYDAPAAPTVGQAANAILNVRPKLPPLPARTNEPQHAAKEGEHESKPRLTEELAWPWQKEETQLLPVVARHLAPLVKKKERTIKEWALHERWRGNARGPDNRTLAVEKERVLKSLHSRGFI